MRTIAIFGGTFDPIHYGHLRPLAQVARALRFNEVRLLPANLPPHRPPPIATAAQRLAMTRLAVAEFPGFVVDERELQRAEPSYTVVTLVSLRADFPDDALCLIVGADAFLGLESWHRWEEIPTLAHLIVMQRPGWNREWPADLPAWAKPRFCDDQAQLAQNPAGLVYIQPITPVAISATAIRAAIARDEPVSGQLPDAVLHYICDNHLYRQK